MYVQIGLAILVLAAFVVAFLSARTWHWGQVLVVLGIVLSTVGFFFLAAETLRINAVLRSQVNQLEAKLASVEARNDALENGTEDPHLIAQLRNEGVPIPEDAESLSSLAELDHQLHLETRIRGRMWRKVVPAGFNPQTGEVKIGVEAPVPSGINRETVVFLFEDGEPVLPAPDGAPRGPQYLGEFRVSEAAPQGATLLPVLPLDEFERQRLAGSRGPWVMYEVMPIDRYQIFAGMSEDDLKKILPPQSVNEYLRHDKAANADDEDVRKAGVDGLYQRRLRDYALEFDELAKQRAVLATDLEGVKLDNQRLETALASAKELQAFREDEKVKLKTDLTGVTKEREAIAAHLKLVEQQLAKAQALLAETLRRNREMAQQLAARQARKVELDDGPSSPAESRGPLALDRIN